MHEHKQEDLHIQKNSTALIIMAKEPRVGSTKTRLCPPLTPEQAAQIYEALLLDTIDIAAGIEGLDLAIAVTPSDAADYFKHITPDGTLLIPVDCPDIGLCLSQVLSELLRIGYNHVLALHSDGPTLPVAYIQEAIRTLTDKDLVFGPAEDGGYYLIGLSRIHTEIFTGIEWSTEKVLSQSIFKADQSGLSVHVLPPWYDVDTANDIHRLRNEIKTLPTDTLRHTRHFLDQCPG